MIPSDFEYFAPTSLSEAVSLLSRYGEDAKILAGGHSLIPMMKLRLAQPRYIIDIGRIGNLTGIREHGGKISIGPLTTHYAIESSALLAEKCPLLCQTALAIGDVQVRNRGTIGGSISHADPAADWPAALLCLGAELRIVGPSGERWMPIKDFIVDTLTTDLKSDEVLTEIHVAGNPPRTGQCYLKLPQKASGFALVGTAVSLTVSGNGKCEQAAVALTGVASRAYRAEEVSKALVGKKLELQTLAEAARKATAGHEPQGDMHASAEYRAEMAHVYTRRALEGAWRKARG